MIYRMAILFLMLMVGLADAELQKETMARITTRVSEGILSGDTPALSEDVERRVQAIVQELVADASVVAFKRRVTVAAEQKKEAERSQMLSRIQTNVIKGVLVCLALLVLAAVVRKIGAAVAASEQADKHSSLVVVNDTLRTAPCVVSIVTSDAEAARVGRSLVDARLAARVDVLPQRVLNASENGSLLLVQTVKGRLKVLKKVLKEYALDQSALSIPVLKGHGDYLNWIADAADGRT